MTKPRIVIVIATFYPHVGGAEHQALLQCQALRSWGYEATIVTLRHKRAWPRHDVVEGAPVLRVGGALLGDRERLPTPLRRLAYLLGVLSMGWVLFRLRRNYDLVQLYRLTAIILPVAFVCGVINKPLITVLCSASSSREISAESAEPFTASGSRERNGDLESLAYLGKPVIGLTRFLLRRARAAMWVLSERMKGDLVAYHFPTAGSRVVPSILDLERFHPADSAPRPPQTSQIILFFGRLVYPKGVDVLLRAWGRVRQEASVRLRARLIIAGEGPLRAEYEQLAQSLGVMDSVEFVGLQRDIVPWLHRSDVVVLPSRWEGMPNAVLEAMACGLPCVATRVSGSEDLIQDGVNGLLVEPDDDEALASALLSLLRDPALCQQYGHAARSTVEERYSLDYVTGMYLELYQQVWRDHTRPARQSVSPQAIQQAETE